jgi:hypothetical protein
MKGEIAVAGFVLTAEEWQDLDAVARAELLPAETPPDAPLRVVVTADSGLLDDPWFIDSSAVLMFDDGADHEAD